MSGSAPMLNLLQHCGEALPAFPGAIPPSLGLRVGAPVRQWGVFVRALGPAILWGVSKGSGAHRVLLLTFPGSPSGLE